MHLDFTLHDKVYCRDNCGPHGTAMNVRNAINQLEQIHDQLTRSEVYRGFRVPGVTAVGIVALVAALGQQYFPGTVEGTGFVTYWVLIAGICGLIGTTTAVHLYSTREDAFARRRTRRVMAQFSPCLLGGAIMTIALCRAPEKVSFLPGIWGIIFGLGIIAASPHLPSGIGMVGLGYVAAGCALLLRVSPNDNPSGWAVGLVFGVGHLLTAFVLWREDEGDPGGSDDGI
jgi:hypothetical protein